MLPQDRGAVVLSPVPPRDFNLMVSCLKSSPSGRKRSEGQAETPLTWALSAVTTAISQAGGRECLFLSISLSLSHTHVVLQD